MEQFQVEQKENKWRATNAL